MERSSVKMFHRKDDGRKSGSPYGMSQYDAAAGRDVSVAKQPGNHSSKQNHPTPVYASTQTRSSGPSKTQTYASATQPNYPISQQSPSSRDSRSPVSAHPPVDLPVSPRAALKRTHTAPLPSQIPWHDHHGHITENTLTLPLPSPRSITSTTSTEIKNGHNWIQKRLRFGGTAPGGYGRHSNDWLFGGFSIRETVKEVIKGGARTSAAPRHTAEQPLRILPDEEQLHTKTPSVHADGNLSRTKSEELKLSKMFKDSLNVGPSHIDRDNEVVDDWEHVTDAPTASVSSLALSLKAPSISMLLNRAKMENDSGKVIKSTDNLKVTPGLSSKDEAARDGDGSPTWSQFSRIASSGEKSFVLGSDSPPRSSLELEGRIDNVTADVATELAALFLGSSDGFRQHVSQDLQGSSSDSKNSDASSTFTIPSLGATRSTSFLVLNNPLDEDDDEDDTRRQKRPRLEVSGHDTAEERLLACPYAKFDPERFSERNQDLREKAYRRCGSVCLTSIPRLKQHLYRVHRRPEFYCLSCFIVFKTSGEHDEHVRMRPPCEVGEDRFAEKMSLDQEKAIKRRKIGEDRVAGWFGLFQTLFPGAQLPDDPYVSNVDLVVPTRVIHRFIELVEREAPRRIAARIAPPLFGEEYAEINQWYLGEVLETALPMVLEELRREYQELEGFSTGFPAAS